MFKFNLPKTIPPHYHPTLKVGDQFLVEYSENGRNLAYLYRSGFKISRDKVVIANSKLETVVASLVTITELPAQPKRILLKTDYADMPAYKQRNLYMLFKRVFKNNFDEAKVAEFYQKFINVLGE